MTVISASGERSSILTFTTTRESIPLKVPLSGEVMLTELMIGAASALSPPMTPQATRRNAAKRNNPFLRFIFFLLRESFPHLDMDTI